MLEKRAHQAPLVPRAGQRSGNGLMKIVHILRNEVGQIAVFGVVPNPLHRVEIRSIGRQPLDLEPVGMRRLQDPDRLAVGVQAVQNRHESAAQVVMEQRQESHDLFPTHVVPMDAKIQPQPPPHRRHSERRNDRQTVAAIPTVLDRRLTARRTTGWSIKPLSSISTMLQPRWWAFF